VSRSHLPASGLTVNELIEILKRSGDGSQRVVLYVRYSDKWHDVISAGIDPYGFSCELKINEGVYR
jgi:hypothetical protein